MTEYLTESTIGQKRLPWGTHRFAEGRDVPATLWVQLLLRMAAGKTDALSGRYIDITDNIDQLLTQVEVIKQDQSYTLRLHKFR